MAECDLLRNDAALMQDLMEHAEAGVHLEHAGREGVENRGLMGVRARLERENMLGAAQLVRSVDTESRALEVAALNTTLTDSRAELDRVYGSRSWKTTEPIRVARRGRAPKS